MPGDRSRQEPDSDVRQLKEKIAAQEKEIELLLLGHTRLQLLQQSLPMALYIAEPFGDYGGTWVSEQIENMTGFSPDQFMADRSLWAARLHPEDRERALAEYGKIHNHEYIEVEYRWQIADGTYRWFRDTATLARDEEGRPEKIIGTWLDITEQKQLAAESEKNRLKFSELANTLPQIIFETDKEGRLTYVNNQAFLLTGYSAEDLANGTNVLEFVHPADKERAANNLQRVMDGEKLPGGNEYTIIRKDGSFMPVMIFSSQRLDNGSHAGLQGIIVDVTEQKRMEEALRDSEERYRSLFEHASDIIQILSPEGRFLYVNPTWLKTYGYTREEVNRMKVFDLIHPDCVDNCVGNFSRVLTEGRLENTEVTFMAKDGRKVEAEGNVNCHMDHGGPKYVQCIFRDVTERKKMEEELRKAHKLESIGILAGGIAHDFNNILTAVIGNISLARIYTQPGDRICEKLGDAERAAMRAKDLTQQLLTFSKGGEPVKRLVRLGELLEEASCFVLRGSNVRCRCEIAEDLWAVDADEGQLSQVIHNLVINADQAMPEGGEVLVRAVNRQVTGADTLPMHEGKYVEVTVSDQGIGIKPEHLGRIFDPYFSTKQKGHGLGLATAYSIVKNHGGVMTVASELGHGSFFTFYIPASSRKHMVDKDQTVDGPHQGNGRILLMDDEKDVRDVATAMLVHLGYEVMTAGDGREAVALYREASRTGNPYDLVIMDLTVPGGVGGREALQQLKEIDPAVKAIVSSGYANDPIMANYARYGFAGVVPKPYKIEEMAGTLAKALR